CVRDGGAWHPPFDYW
nr:immunoglobulin heavy chain junction region [Macaca mulatta]MOX39318.1 immunoglobulin heavy chain junction region [Macaca mulatta]MOX40523.1 immunoglobulin heavy chain junction region [Macaca mulatta]